MYRATESCRYLKGNAYVSDVYTHLHFDETVQKDERVKRSPGEPRYKNDGLKHCIYARYTPIRGYLPRVSETIYETSKMVESSGRG